MELNSSEGRSFGSCCVGDDPYSKSLISFLRDDAGFSQISHCLSRRDHSQLFSDVSSILRLDEGLDLVAHEQVFKSLYW